MTDSKTSSMNDQSGDYKKDSLSLWGAVSLGTGVMIGAGIFALTGQVAQLAGQWFPFAFIVAAIVSGFSAYSYVKLSDAFPSAGGIATFLQKAYGKSSITAGCALLMYFSMVINESLVARTFGTYTLQLFNVGENSWLVPALGVALLAFAFGVNIMGNEVIEKFSFFTAFLKIAGLVVLAGGGLWVSGLKFPGVSVAPSDTGFGGFLGAVALGILAYKGFTTITNSGGEIKEPHKNVGRAIVISLAICAVIYLLVSLAVGANLTVEQIVQARDFSLTAASRPAFGQWGVYLTVGFAIVATVSGVIASAFAVSRMLAMLTSMKLVPYRKFGIKGDVQRHTLIYTIAIAMLLTIFFDLSRIASLGAIFYIIMDMAIHWGVLRHLKRKVKAQSWVLVTALVLDAVVLCAFLVIKARSDFLVIVAAALGIALIFGGERWFLRGRIW